MATTLVSPGIAVDVIDQSLYASNGPGTVPFILLATRQDKTNPSGTIAAATQKANAGQVYSVSSRRELLNLFGAPVFPTGTTGSIIYGSEISEYGLLAAHSILDITSQVYVMRADVDLSQLTSSGTRPTGAVAGGTLYLDAALSQWGIFEFSEVTGNFTVKTPLVITSSAQLQGGIPTSSVGAVGTYAVVATNANNPIYYKNSAGNWVLVGSTNWQNSWPTLQGTNYNATVTSLQSILINRQSVQVTGTTLANLVTAINNKNIAGVTASAANGYLKIFVTNAASSTNGAADGMISISNVGMGTILSDVGLVAGTYQAPQVDLTPHTQVPAWRSYDATPAPTGSVWIKTTAVGNGAQPAVYRYSTTSLSWELQSVNLYSDDVQATYTLDPTAGGLGIANNNLYMQYDVNKNSTVTYKLFERTNIGTTVVSSTTSNPTLTANTSFTIEASIRGSSNTTGAVTISLGGVTSIGGVIGLILAAGIPNVNAYVNSSGGLSIEHTAGGVLYLKNISGTPLTQAGITTALPYTRLGPDGATIIVSNWTLAPYTATTTPPIAAPADQTLWYARRPVAFDIMINDGTNWKGYRGVSSDARGYDLTLTDASGVIVSASKPTKQTNGNALSYGDIWIDTSTFETLTICRWQSVNGDNVWVKIDNTDHTSENGIIFADARWDATGTADPALDTIPSVKTMLTSDYTDPDCPDPASYPRGMLLFNTRRSSLNVKKYVVNKWNAQDYPLQQLPTQRNSWVSVSGSDVAGVAFIGRRSVREVIVKAMKSAIDSSTQIREDSRFFNLITAPGYPELVTNMIALNVARRETAFIIGDLPLSLSSDETVLTNYFSNSSSQPYDNEYGLVSNYQFLSFYYPPAVLANDTYGNTVVAPASHAVLRAFINSDNKSAAWFAPAGETRGMIDNASQIGYLVEDTSTFVPVGNGQSLRDLLYATRINPITVFAGSGILIYGQKTRATQSTALDRINVARLINYIRYNLERITKPLIFEPNDTVTRNQAKQAVEQLLNGILTRRGLYDYLVVCDTTNNTPATINANELHIDVAIEPTKAVEFIYIPIRILNTGGIAAGNLSAKAV
jgi:hypothetical protein